MNNKLKMLAASIMVAGALGATHQAEAATAANAEMNISGIGGSSFAGANLNTASTFTFGTAANTHEFIVTSTDATLFGNPNDFNTGSGTVPDFSFGDITQTTINIASFSAITNFMTWSTGTTPTNRYSFDLNTLFRNTSASGALDLYGTGTFHDANSTFSDATASIRITGNTISGNSASWSASWATPPLSNSTTIPEPNSIALLGLGLAAAAAMRKKRIG
ncbi:MAG: PEP-CTERM sorting domain-containing protein [Methylovulum sp.]|nr:PEP-CTERM sorting domain-containing protein [Methylovulum sp.]